MKSSNIQLLLLRLAIGGLFLSIGLEKIHEGWLTNSIELSRSLTEDHAHASGAQLKYLDYVAIPYMSLWAKLIAAGEIALAGSLLLGLFVRLSSFLGVFMVLNLHAATGTLFSLRFFETPWAALLTVGLLILFLARAGRWAGLDVFLASSNSKGMFW